MAGQSGSGSRGKAVMAGTAIIAAAIIVAFGARMWDRGRPPAPAVGPADSQTQATGSAPAPSPAAATGDATALPPQDTVKTDAQTGATAPQTDAVSTAQADKTVASDLTKSGAQPAAQPSFDVVRVDPQGGAVVAGKSAPGAKVQVLIDGKPVAEATADGGGKFVALFDAAPSSAPQVVTLQSKGEGTKTVSSQQTVILAPRQAVLAGDAAGTDAAAGTTQLAQTGATVAKTATPQASAGEIVIATISGEGAQGSQPAPGTPTPTTADVGGGATDTVVAPSSTAGASDAQTAVATGDPASASGVATQETAPTATAPTVLLADQQGIKVLQSPGPKVLDSIVLDTITYEAAGEVKLAGRATSDAFIRVYIDNRLVQSNPTNADGSWEAKLADVKAGVYTLRVDQLDSAGAVTSRVQTPFKRESKDVVRQAVVIAAGNDASPDSTANAPVDLSVVTVQPGSTLWAIARSRFGRGILYVRVFEANRDQIKDPDLIYPGQVFKIPKG